MHSYFTGFVEINGLPFLACMAVSGILVYLGMHVVERKVIFVDLALAQIAAFGVMWAILMGYNHEEDTIAVTLFSLAFTVAGALIFAVTRTSNKRVPHEALIGIVYVTATAAGLVLSDRFALGTEALKELIAGRVALVTGDILVVVATTCAVVGLFHFLLRRVFLRISTDHEAAESDGIHVRIWDFLFYLSFGVLITQVVTVLGVLPVFAYLVIPAVAGALLFESIKARLIFGWAFATIGSFAGLEVARLSGLDPGPTLVCLFASALVILGVILFIRSQGLTIKTLLRVAGTTILVATFFFGTLFFRKAEATDEFKVAVEYASSGEVSKLRQAMKSFERFPERREEWTPLVISMLEATDPVAREDAAVLLGSSHHPAVLPALFTRLDDGVEDDDSVREKVVKAIGKLGDSSALPRLVAAAEREIESDIAIEMCETIFELGENSQLETLRVAGDVLVEIIDDEGAPRAARHDAEQFLRRHLTPSSASATNGIGRFWREQREQLSWNNKAKRFVSVHQFD